MYQVYELANKGIKIGLPYESLKIAASQARLYSAINKTETCVLDDETGEDIIEYLEGLHAWGKEI